ncbi:hypothetical protein RD136_004576 [Salmonella enterica]|nr:hypothetical protein [Salmonella enterica]
MSRQARSARGLELEGKGEITSGTQIRGSVTLTNAEIIKSNDHAELGRKMPDMPARMAALWVDHRFLPELMAGLGVRYASGTYNTSNQKPVKRIKCRFTFRKRNRNTPLYSES